MRGQGEEKWESKSGGKRKGELRRLSGEGDEGEKSGALEGEGWRGLTIVAV